MKVTHPSKPGRGNYQPHRCEWGFRNPKNHLTSATFTTLIDQMLKSDDKQHIPCPGCGRSIYLSLRIEGHNLPGNAAHLGRDTTRT